MLGLTRLHDIAATRGDGMRPELLEFLRLREAAMADPKVADMAAHSPGPAQAGPNQPRHPADQLPAGVLAFPTRFQQNQSQQPSRRSL